MSETREGNRGWIIGVAIGVLILSIIISCFVGAFAGYFAGRAATRANNLTQIISPNIQITPIPRFQAPGSGNGITAVGVTAGGPAEKAGILAGDRIVAVDGVNVTTPQTLIDLMALHKPGDQVKVTVQRGLSQRDFAVQLGQNPSDPTKAYLGITYNSMISPGGTQTPD